MPQAQSYTWTAPKFFVGQLVAFLNHRGSQRTGEISRIVSSYVQSQKGVLEASHEYSIILDHSTARARWHVAEENILYVLGNVAD